MIKGKTEKRREIVVLRLVGRWRLSWLQAVVRCSWCSVVEWRGVCVGVVCVCVSERECERDWSTVCVCVCVCVCVHTLGFSFSLSFIHTTHTSILHHTPDLSLSLKGILSRGVFRSILWNTSAYKTKTTLRDGRECVCMHTHTEEYSVEESTEAFSGTPFKNAQHFSLLPD